MKTLSVSDIVSRVRTKYDEIGLNQSEIMSSLEDNVNFDTIVKGNIEAAYIFVSKSADLSMLEGKSDTSLSLAIDSNLVGRVTLPDDFLRGVTARLSSWDSSFVKIITEDEPEYRMQSDKYACGTYQYPIIALVHTKDGKQFEFYKAKASNDTLKSFVYVPTPSIISDSIDVPDMLVESFIYYVAALTATTFREDVANDFFKVAKALLGIE